MASNDAQAAQAAQQAKQTALALQLAQQAKTAQINATASRQAASSTSQAIARAAAIGNQYLTFQGIGFSSGKSQSFDVMVGDNPPTITGGYASWQNLARPLQRALTIFQDYDPITMKVEVRFGVFANQEWQNDDATGATVEGDINALEWMAGSGFQAGPPPYVYVWSYSTAGGGAQTNLIPAPARGSGSVGSLPWVITALEWGKAYRNRNGFRTWQEATITLSHYLNLNPAPTPDSKTTGQYFISKPGRDTAMTIAAAPANRSPLVDQQSLAKSILACSQNNPIKGTSIKLARKSVSWQIRNGLRVWVPAHTIT